MGTQQHEPKLLETEPQPIQLITKQISLILSPFHLSYFWKCGFLGFYTTFPFLKKMDISEGMTIASIFSVAGTFSIIVTYALFPKLRQLRYIELVFYVALNDFVGSLGTAMGYNHSGTFRCWFQGIVTSYNFLSGVFWSVVIAYQLYLIVVKQGRYLENLTYCHLICWLFPLVMTVLPLSTNTYGEADDAPGWCFIANRRNSPSWGIVTWEILSFYLWLWLAILVIFVLFLSIACRLRSELALTDVMSRGLYRLGMYPIIFVLCWTLDTYLYIDTGVAHTNNISGYNDIVFLSGLLASLQGFFITMIFFSRNDVVRNEWIALFTGKETTDLELLFNKERSSMNQDFSNNNFSQSTSAYVSNTGHQSRNISTDNYNVYSTDSHHSNLFLRMFSNQPRLSNSGNTSSNSNSHHSFGHSSSNNNNNANSSNNKTSNANNFTLRPGSEIGLTSLPECREASDASIVV